MKTQEVHAAPQTIGAITKTGSGVPAAVSFASVLSGIREEARARAAGILRDAAPCAREEATTKLRGDLSTETVRRLLPDGTLRITEYQDGKVKSVGTKEEIQAETKRILEKAGRTGIILGADCTVLPGTPWEMTSYTESGVRCAARVASVNAIGGGLNACAAGPSP